MLFSENIGLVAFPKPPPDDVIDRLADQTANIVQYAKGGYPASSTNGLQMHLSETARDVYEAMYPRLKQWQDSDFIGALLARRAP